MAWTRHRPNKDHSLEPQATIYQSLNGYLNSPCDERYCAGHDECIIHRDAEHGRIAIEPVDDGDYSLSRSNGPFGADVNFRNALRAIGLDEDSLDDTVFVDVEWSDEVGVVIDVSHLREAGSDAAASDDSSDTVDDEPNEDASEDRYPTESDSSATSGVTDDGEEDSLPFELGATKHPQVERRVAEKLASYDAVSVEAADIAQHVDTNAAWTARTIMQLDEDDDVPVRVNRDHADDPNTTTLYHISVRDGELGEVEISSDSDDEPAAEDDDDEDDLEHDADWVNEEQPDDAPDAGEADADDIAVTLQAADDVDSVQQLAEELETTDGRARYLAREAGIYGDLKDDVRPMGASDAA